MAKLIAQVRIDVYEDEQPKVEFKAIGAAAVSPEVMGRVRQVLRLEYRRYIQRLINEDEVGKGLDEHGMPIVEVGKEVKEVIKA